MVASACAHTWATQRFVLMGGVGLGWVGLGWVPHYCAMNVLGTLKSALVNMHKALPDPIKDTLAVQ
jgi:hypothetical protein